MAIPAQVVGADVVGRAAQEAWEARVGMRVARAVRGETEAAVAAVAGRTGSSYHPRAAPPRRPNYLLRSRSNRCEARNKSPRSLPTRCHLHMVWPSSLAG